MAALSGLIGAGIGAAGAIGQGLISSAFNMHEASKNRRFQERMSNTSHQREVADLRAAGLNPILSSKLGGASSPPGSSAQASSPDVAQAGTHGFLAQQQRQLNEANIRDVNSATALKDAQRSDILSTQSQRIDLLIAQRMEMMTRSDLDWQTQQKISVEIENLRQQRKLLEIETTSSALGLDHARRESEFSRGIGGKIAPWMKLNPLGNTGINLLRLKTRPFESESTTDYGGGQKRTYQRGRR